MADPIMPATAPAPEVSKTPIAKPKRSITAEVMTQKPMSPYGRPPYRAIGTGIAGDLLREFGGKPGHNPALYLQLKVDGDSPSKEGYLKWSQETFGVAV